MSPYEKKFASFLRMIEVAKTGGTQCVVVHRPEVLGDSYEEVVESLRRLAEAQLAVAVVPPTEEHGGRTSPPNEVEALAELERAARRVDRAYNKAVVCGGADLPPGDLGPALNRLNGAIYELDSSRG